jgi:hypothetical protein
MQKNGENYQGHKEHKVKAKIRETSHIHLVNSVLFVTFVSLVVEVLFDFT